VLYKARGDNTRILWGCNSDLPKTAKFLCNDFPKRLRDARLALTPKRGGYVSPEALAGEIGVTDQTIRNYENVEGGTEPGLEMVERLAAVLGISPGELAFGENALTVAEKPYPPLPPKPAMRSRGRVARAAKDEKRKGA
jgi:transcriptional regulator with XRE-family HTH domain